MTDHDFIAVVRDMFEKQVPFNRQLGIELGTITEERVELAFPMQESLIGSFVRGTLHGGVISAVLDVAGGLAAFLSIIRRKQAEGAVDVLEQFARLGTIDLRVDYLRPGKGERFTAVGTILRTGSRVAVARTELHDEHDALIALGTGAYVVD